MTVKYEENKDGIFWVDGDQKGEPQKDLRHAMDDYELTVAGLKKEDQREGGSSEGGSNGEESRVHTGDDGGPAGQLIADNFGSAGEGQEADGS